MSAGQEFANAVGLLETNKGRAIAQGQLDKGNIYGGLVSNLGAVVPQQVQQAIAANAQKRKQMQIQSILQESGGDFQTALPKIAAIDPGLAMSFQKELTAADEVKNKADELKAKHQQEMREFGLKTLSTAQSEGEWASGIKGMHDAGLDVSWIDPTFTPDSAKRIQSMLGQGTARPVAPKVSQITTVDADGNPITKFVEDTAGTEYPQPPPKPQAAGRPVAVQTVDEKGNPVTKFVTPKEGQSFPRPRPAMSQGGGAGQGTGTLTDDAVEDTATKYRILGTAAIPTRIEAPERVRIMNAAAKQQRALGQTAAQAVQKQAAFKSDAASLTQMQKMASSAEAFENKALAQADLVSNLSSKVGRTSSPLFNEWLLSGKKKVLGDKDTSLLFNALDSFTSEYAKILGGSTGSASGATVAATRKAEGLISAAMSKGTLAATVDQMKWEMAQTMKGYDATINHITERMGGAPAAPTTPQAGTVPANVSTLLQAQKPGEYTLSDGHTYRRAADGKVTVIK